MTYWDELKSIMGPKNNSQQAEYRDTLVKILKSRNFVDLSEEEKKEVLEVAAKDFSGKFKEDIAVLANE